VDSAAARHTTLLLGISSPLRLSPAPFPVLYTFLEQVPGTSPLRETYHGRPLGTNLFRASKTGASYFSARTTTPYHLASGWTGGSLVPIWGYCFFFFMKLRCEYESGGVNGLIALGGWKD